jgi:hypothetical protein
MFAGKRCWSSSYIDLVVDVSAVEMAMLLD